MVAINKHTRHQVVRLPTLRRDSARLATNCLLVGEGQRADIVWATDGEFLSLCDRMLNGRDQREFVVGYRDANSQPCYKRAYKSTAHRHAQWVLDTIRGRATKPATMAFYSRDREGQSNWGALDFDCHSGNRERARRYASAAFQVLLAYRELRIVVCTSGETGGWHVIVFSDHFHSVREWEKLLRQVAAFIGAPIESGVCEIMPRETRGCFGPALRPPGSWNPRDNSFGSIFFENVRPALTAGGKAVDLPLKRLTSFKLGKESLCHEGSEIRFCELGKETVFCELGKESPLFRGKSDCWAAKHAISRPDSRHEKLIDLVSDAFPQAGRNVVRQNAALQYAEAEPSPKTSLDGHMADFDQMWRGLNEKWTESLSEPERALLSSLHTEIQRDAFRIVRGWARLAATATDFHIHAQSLADRLGISRPGACELRKLFCSLGILRQTAAYVPRKAAARFKWLVTSKPS